MIEAPGATPLGSPIPEPPAATPATAVPCPQEPERATSQGAPQPARDASVTRMGVPPGQLERDTEELVEKQASAMVFGLEPRVRNGWDRLTPVSMMATVRPAPFQPSVTACCTTTILEDDRELGRRRVSVSMASTLGDRRRASRPPASIDIAITGTVLGGVGSV